MRSGVLTTISSSRSTDGFVVIDRDNTLGTRAFYHFNCTLDMDTEAYIPVSIESQEVSALADTGDE